MSHVGHESTSGMTHSSPTHGSWLGYGSGQQFQQPWRQNPTLPTTPLPPRKALRYTPAPQKSPKPLMPKTLVRPPLQPGRPRDKSVTQHTQQTWHSEMKISENEIQCKTSSPPGRMPAAKLVTSWATPDVRPQPQATIGRQLGNTRCPSTATGNHGQPHARSQPWAGPA